MSSARRWKHRVRHILHALEKIQRYTQEHTPETFAEDEKTLDAVIRNFQVIGEAARKVPDDIQHAHPELPWSDMQKMRHVLVHDYDRVDAAIVWDTIQKHLGPLIPLLEQIVQEAEE